MVRHARDFTYRETIYKRHVRTVSVRIAKDGALYERRLRTLTVRRVLDQKIRLSSLRPIHGAGEIEHVLQGLFKRYEVEQEHFVVLFIGPPDQLIAFQRISSGTRTSVMVDRTLTFRNAMLLRARSIIVAHNHPDGSPAPSAQDVMLTKSLIEAGQILNIEVLDHIIVTPQGTCTSLKEREPHLFPPSKPAAPVT